MSLLVAGNFINETLPFRNSGFCSNLTIKVDELIRTGHYHSVAAEVLLNVAGRKMHQAVQEQKVLFTLPNHKRSDTMTLKPCKPGRSSSALFFALSLTEEEKAADHSTTNCGLFYLFTNPILFLCLSLLHMHTAAH